jgi:Lon protease-like protein
MTRLPALPLRRVLLPGGRVDVRLAAHIWRAPLAAASGVAAFFVPGGDGRWPVVGTLAAPIGRRTDGDLIHVRLRGLRRLSALTVPAGPGTEVDVVLDPAPIEDGPPISDELQSLVRRYHALLAEHGDRADIGVELPQEPEAAAYRVASLLRISAHERQFLLEAETTHERVERVVAVLRRETELLRRTMGPKGA